MLLKCMNLLRIIGIFYLGFLLVMPLHAQAAWWWPFGKDKGLEYHVETTGISSNMEEWFEELRLTEATKTNLPNDYIELRQEAVSIASRMRTALEARGYYDAIINQSIHGDQEPYVLKYVIRPGNRYKISNMYTEWPGKSLKKVNTIPVKTRIGDPVDVAVIQEDSTILLKEIGRDNCLLFLNITPLLRLHGQTHEAEIVFRVDHGPSADFGKVIVDGNVDVNDKVIQRSVVWKQGECFAQDKVNTTRSNLIQNQLFASVDVTPASEPDALGQVPISITVKERVPRTITAGVNFSTDQGAGLVTGWEHRNLLGNGERFNAILTLAQQEQSLINNLRIPAFLRNDQTLALLAGIRRENTDIYTSQSLDVGATLEKKLSPRLNSGLGIAYRITQTEDLLVGNSRYGLLSFPGFLEYNSRDNDLDTRKGFFGRVALTPYTETFGDGGQFFKTQATGQTYLSSDTITYKPTLALRLTAGSIAGAEGTDVPADIRFYAGSGGSVRGYSFQSLGPRVNGVPIGGSSLLVGSSELRLRFTETVGGVFFVDAGNAYESNFPGIGDELYYGAGVGARYYSPIGPLRFDIGFPLNGKDIGQTGFQLYVSLGQSF